MTKTKICDPDRGGCGRSEEFLPSGDGGGWFVPIRVGRRSGLCAACRCALAEAKAARPEPSSVRQK